jgi:hypothetical protein
MHWFYLSFCDDTRPAGGQFLGACVVGPVPHMIDAVQLAHRLGCNPGGEVMGIALPDDIGSKIPASLKLRLLSRAEAESLDRLYD